GQSPAQLSVPQPSSTQAVSKNVQNLERKRLMFYPLASPPFTSSSQAWSVVSHTPLSVFLPAWFKCREHEHGRAVVTVGCTRCTAIRNWLSSNGLFLCKWLCKMTPPPRASSPGVTPSYRL